MLIITFMEVTRGKNNRWSLILISRRYYVLWLVFLKFKVKLPQLQRNVFSFSSGRNKMKRMLGSFKTQNIKFSATRFEHSLPFSHQPSPSLLNSIVLFPYQSLILLRCIDISNINQC